jgi:FkbM family methyltransferase
MSDTALIRRGPGHLELRLNGVAHDIRFPDEGNLEAIVLKVLGGQEYPTLRLPGWSPVTIIDIGANVGASALFFALSYPEARVRCWEPSPSTARYLEANTAWLPQVEIETTGLFDSEAELRLYRGTAQCAQASVAVSVETREDAYETIRLEPARRAIGVIEGPAILKIDTEGCEVPVLTDLGDRLDAFDVVYLEYHSERDRRALDAILGERFSLWRSSAHAVHRGTAAYLNERMLQVWPRLGALEIDARRELAAS